MAPRIVIEAVKGPLCGSRFAFDQQDTFVFGRSRDCHAQLSRDDTTISRRHFILEIDPPEVRLRDLGSLNGTYVNGKKYGGRKKNETPEAAVLRSAGKIDLKDKDEICIGDTVFSVHIEPEPLQPKITFLGTAAFGDCAAINTRALLSGLKATEEEGREHAEMARQAGYGLLRMLDVSDRRSVYYAERQADGAQVVFTIVRCFQLTDERRARFLSYMEPLTRLENDHIVKVMDYGASKRALYYVSDYSEGGNLDQRKKGSGGKLPLWETLRIAYGCAEVLQFSHDIGVMHGELKPANILFDNNGALKIANTGIIAALAAAGVRAQLQSCSLGQLNFLAPEQLVQFSALKPQSDVWSLGAIVYCCLTGHSPRVLDQTDDRLEVVLRGRHAPVRQLNPSVPRKVAKVLDRALALNPHHRYQSAADFHDALQSSV